MKISTHNRIVKDLKRIGSSFSRSKNFNIKQLSLASTNVSNFVTEEIKPRA